jgi:hypothetical protein
VISASFARPPLAAGQQAAGNSCIRRDGVADWQSQSHREQDRFGLKHVDPASHVSAEA